MTISLSGLRRERATMVGQDNRRILCWRFVDKRFRLSPRHGPFTVIATDEQPLGNDWWGLVVCNKEWDKWDHVWEYGWLDYEQWRDDLPVAAFHAMYPAARDLAAKFFREENRRCKYRKIWVRVLSGGDHDD